MSKQEKEIEEMHLGELTSEWREIQALLETAEIDELDTLDLDRALSKIHEARISKISNCVKLFKYYECLGLGVDSQIERLQKYSKRISKRAERLTQWLELNLEQSEGFQFDHGEIVWRKSTAVEPAQLDAPVPDQYQRIKVEPNKIEMAKDLKAGATIPGWLLVVRNKLKIR